MMGYDKGVYDLIIRSSRISHDSQYLIFDHRSSDHI